MKYSRTANRALGRVPEFLVLFYADLDLNCRMLAECGNAAPHNNSEKISCAKPACKASGYARTCAAPHHSQPLFGAVAPGFLLRVAQEFHPANCRRHRHLAEKSK